MLTVSNKSWHYRLQAFFNFDEPQNLCQYIRRIVSSFILAIWGIFITMMAALVLLCPIVILLIAAFTDSTIGHLILLSDLEPIFVLGLLADAWILGTALLLLNNEYTKHSYRNIFNTNVKLAIPETSTSSFMALLFAYARAGKRKICPLINVQNDEIK